MSPEQEIDQAFQEAYERATNTSRKFPPDVMLMFYAYYKQATEKSGFYNPATGQDVRSAFKLNALIQVKGMSVQEAKRRYIELVNLHIGK